METNNNQTVNKVYRLNPVYIIYDEKTNTLIRKEWPNNSIIERKIEELLSSDTFLNVNSNRQNQDNSQSNVFQIDLDTLINTHTTVRDFLLNTVESALK